MNHSSYGAVVHGRPGSSASTVEARMIDGGRVVALIAVQGDLATPSLESVKGAFARLAQGTEAGKLASAAPPPPYASGVAVVLLAGGRAYVATTGEARCYLERGGVLHELAAGPHDVRSGDVLIAASESSLEVKRRFFVNAVQPAANAEFRNDLLDDVLASALEAYPPNGLAVSAAWIG